MATTNHHSSFWPSWEENKPFALLLIILLAYSIVFLAMKMEQIGKPDPYEHQITVEGVADTKAIPDLATITVGIDTQGEDVATAQNENSSSMNALIAKMKALGLAADDLQTSNYNVYENTQWNGETYVSNGWVVSNQLKITVRDNNLVAGVLDTAGQNGATNISGPSFAVDDTESLKQELRTAAIADAQKQAAKIAAALGVGLERVVGYSEWTDNGPEVYSSSSKEAYGGGAPTVEPGSTQTTLHVSVTYRLEE